MLSRPARQLVHQLLKKRSLPKNAKATIYLSSKEIDYPEHVRVVDYRSDTFSKPSQQMRKAMYEANVGDDVYGEDPTVNELENKAAALFGKEACVFCASGTMSNLLAVLTHSKQRGCEVLVGDESHILMWEQAGAALVGGVQLRSVANLPNGTFSLTEMASKIRSSNVKFLPKTSLVCIENTHNSCGGRVLPLSWIRELGEVLKDFNVPLHLDGARFFNSLVFYGVPAKDAVKECDSISLCLSKGLGAPMGSLLIGASDFIERAKHLRKVIGGGMRQIGLMAAAGIYALDNMVDRMKEDHEHAFAIGKAISEYRSNVVTVDVDAVETNILLIQLDTRYVKSDEFCNRLATVTNDELSDPNPTAVKMLPWSPGVARLVVCCNNSLEDRLATIKKMERVVWEFEQRRVGQESTNMKT